MGYILFYNDIIVGLSTERISIKMKMFFPGNLLTPSMWGRLYKSESEVCRRQILTYKDDPCTERIKILILIHNIGIQMEQKELTKSFMMISKKNNSVL